MAKPTTPIFQLLASILCTYFMLATCETYASICTKTPYPKLCNSLINTTRQSSLDGNLLDLRNRSLSETLVQAQKAYKIISKMNLTSFDKLSRSAWNDCLELYEDTIYQLNQSACSVADPIDAQILLSAAIANKETCLNGFRDFNLSPHVRSFEFMLSDFSKFLINSLAINEAAVEPYSNSDNHNRHRRHLFTAVDDGFPEWVSVVDRKLLQLWIKADIVVSQDGSGDYTTISEGLAAAEKWRRDEERRFVIYVKKGVYRENVEVKRSMKNLMFVGDGINQTIVTGDKSFQDGFPTFKSATFAVFGSGFIARGMTFENTAGPQKYQAVALRASSDHSIFYRCSFKGYQDTLYVYSGRQFYRNCEIYGTIDFIFGFAAAVLQHCHIYIRKPMHGQENVITAHGRQHPSEHTGIIIHNSVITAAPDLRLSQNLFKSYLGRPWKKYSRTVFLKCYIDGVIDEQGWLPWKGDFALSTLYYGEYKNVGRGARIGGRVKWPGFHVIKSRAVARRFSVENFLGGEWWIASSGVPFTSGL